MFAHDNFLPNDPNANWNGTYKGKDVGPGVYLYFVEIEFMDGRTEKIIGDLTVIK